MDVWEKRLRVGGSEVKESEAVGREGWAGRRKEGKRG